MFLFVVFTALATAVTSQTVSQYDADHDEYPYIVSIHGQRQSKDREVPPYRICSGSLISDTWVLTAAHCIVTHAIRIRYGDLSLPKNMSSYSNILKMVPHPGYHVVGVSQTGFTHVVHAVNDVGMMLVEKVSLRGFAKLSSVDYKSIYGLVVTYAGYSTKASKDSKSKKGVRQGEEHLQSSEGAVGPCDGSPKARSVLGLCVVQKCAVTYENRYQGDMGGPLLHEEKIVGVCTDTSQSRTVGFTPVSPYLEWLYDTVNGTNPNKKQTL